MTTYKQKFEQILTALPKRSLQSTLFNISHAYARSANYTWSAISKTKDADFAAPAIMCKSFAIELLLKFFLAVDHPKAATVDDLKNAGVRLKCHKYSELFDQLLQETKDRIAKEYTTQSGKQIDALGFRQALIEQGDDPFVYWRYIYETSGFSHFDCQAFDLIVSVLGKTAEAVRRESSR